MKKYYPGIQVLRGVLFLFILAFHCEAPYSNFGWGGVESFFVLSAFFLVRKFWGRETIDVKKQFWHRIKRLYPSYIAVLLVAVLYAILMRAVPYDLIPHLLSAQNIQWMITGYHSALQPMTAHTWTLSIEVWGGLVYLLLLHCLSKNGFRNAMFGMLFLGVAYRVVTIIFGASVWIVSLCPLAHFDAFACGSLLAICVEENKVDHKVGILWILGLVGIVGCILWISYSNGISFMSAYQLLSASKNYLNNWLTGNIYLFISLMTTGIIGLVCIHDEKRTYGERKIEKAFVMLGDNSYVLYLFHWPVLVLLKKMVHHWGVLFLLTFIVTIGAAFTFTWLYIRVRKRFSRAKRNNNSFI